MPGVRYPGGPANAEALARPARPRRGGAAPGGNRCHRSGEGRSPQRGTEREPAIAIGRAGRRRVSAEPAEPPARTPLDPALERFLRSLAARDASPHTQRAYTHRGRRLPLVAGRPRLRLAPSGAGGPARLPGRARGAATPGRRLPNDWRPSGPSTAGRRGTTSLPATRGARSPHLDCRAGCPASWRSNRSAGCWPSSRPTSRRPPSGTRHVPRCAWPSRCATGRWSRRPTRPGCGSASWPRPSSGRSTCGAARSASWARAARNGSASSGARHGPPWRTISRRVGRCSSSAGRTGARRRPRSS